VLHLRTPVLAELREPHHVLELVERLHPTPAVGGVPRTEALAWIAEHERRPRGWYAGPVGWFDAAGDGEFSVALRSGLLLGSTAHLYAGGGIVADSDAAGELAETQLKLAALLDALTGSDVDPAAPPAGGE
jgi:isochorismate synthase EntC